MYVFIQYFCENLLCFVLVSLHKLMSNMFYHSGELSKISGWFNDLFKTRSRKAFWHRIEKGGKISKTLGTRHTTLERFYIQFGLKVLGSAVEVFKSWARFWASDPCSHYCPMSAWSASLQPIVVIAVEDSIRQ